MKKLKFFRIVALVCFLVIFVSLSADISVYAAENAPDASGVRYVYLYNIENAKVIFSKGSDTDKISPASTVKIMSGLVAIRHLEERLDEYVTITSDMLQGVEGYTLKIKSGDTVKIKDILYGLICGGGNDAALILAHICSGSVENFVEEMNAEARALGMSDTIYKNPTGIDEYGMITSVKDTVVLSKRAIKTPLFIEMSSASEYKYSENSTNEERTIANRNPLISNYSAIGYKNKYVKGLNSGMTNNGGYCVSAYAKNGDDSFLCIVMGGEQRSDGKITSYTVANELINYGINNFEQIKIASKGDVVCTLPVELALPTNGAQTVTVDCVIEKDIYAYAPKNIDYKQDLTYKTYFINKTLTAPIDKDAVVGSVDIFYGDDHLASARLVAADSITESKLLVVLKDMREIIIPRVILVLIIILSVVLFLYFVIFRKKIKRKRMRKMIYNNSNKNR